TYPHPATAFAPEDDDGDSEFSVELGVFCEFAVVPWTTVDVCVVELEVEFLYGIVVVVVPVDVKDAVEEVDDKDWDKLGNKLVEVPVEGVVLVTEDPAVEEADDAIENIGE